MQKHVGLAFTKTNQTRWDSHDNTFSDYHPYIDLSNHTHHNLPCLHTTHIQSHTTQHTVTTTHSPSQLHLYYTLKTSLTHTTNYWSTFHIFNQCNCMVTLHTTNPYIYKQTNPPLQQALAPYLKGTVYKAMASCENCETISGVYKSAMAQVTCTMGYAWDLYPREDILLPSGTNPIQLETHGTTITLLSTPFNAHPNPQSNPTIHNTHVHTTTMNRELWCVWLERSM